MRLFRVLLAAGEAIAPERAKKRSSRIVAQEPKSRNSEPVMFERAENRNADQTIILEQFGVNNKADCLKVA